MPKAKYILHATKVDRIAIVDRPAVPNANICLFKRMGSNGNVKVGSQIEEVLKSVFASNFMYSAVRSAVDALQQAVFDSVYSGKAGADLESEISDSFVEFSMAIDSIRSLGLDLADLEMSQEQMQKMELPTADEVVTSFNNANANASIQGAFQNFRGGMGWLCCAPDMPNADESIKALTEALKAYLIDTASTIQKSLKDEIITTINKEGRIVASSRLMRLKEMKNLLSEIITESETKAQENRRRRGGFKIMDKAQQEKLAETLKMFGEKLVALEAKMEEVSVKAEKSLSFEAMITEVQTALKGLTETIEAVKNAHDSATKPLAERLQPLSEKMLKVEADILAEKSARELSEARLAKAEKMLEAYQASIDTIGKRLGVKTSVEGTVEKNEKQVGDVFGDAVRGKK